MLLFNIKVGVQFTNEVNFIFVAIFFNQLKHFSCKYVNIKWMLIVIKYYTILQTAVE